MGYIDGFEDIMAMETGFLQYTMELLKKEYAKGTSDILGSHTAECRARFRPCVSMKQNREWQKNMTASSVIHTILEPEEEASDRSVLQKKSIGAVILYLSHIIRPRNVRFMRWMIRQIRLIP